MVVGHLWSFQRPISRTSKTSRNDDAGLLRWLQRLSEYSRTESSHVLSVRSLDHGRHLLAVHERQSSDDERRFLRILGAFPAAVRSPGDGSHHLHRGAAGCHHIRRKSARDRRVQGRSTTAASQQLLPAESGRRRFRDRSRVHAAVHRIFAARTMAAR